MTCLALQKQDFLIAHHLVNNNHPKNK